MTQIILCDDEETVVNKIEMLTEAYHKERCTFEEITINKYLNPQKLLDDYAKNDENLILLDIGMKPMTGLELAHKIRQVDKNASIVFITGFEHHAMDAFKVHAFEYLIKPIDKQKLWDLFDEYFKHRKARLSVEKTYFTFRSGTKQIRVDTDLIYYLEKYKNDITIVMIGNEIEYEETLKEALVRLPESFRMCHRSYIVNLQKVIQRTRTFCLLENGKELSVSRSYQDDIKEAYVNYLDGFSRSYKK